MTAKEQIIQHEEQLISAVVNANLPELDRLIHDDRLFNLPDGRTITKEQDLENYRNGSVKIHEILTSERIINIIGDTAVVALKVEMKGNYLDRKMDGTFRYLRVWKQFGNEWKFIAGSSIPL